MLQKYIIVSSTCTYMKVCKRQIYQTMQNRNNLFIYYYSHTDMKERKWKKINAA